LTASLAYPQYQGVGGYRCMCCENVCNDDDSSPPDHNRDDDSSRHDRKSKHDTHVGGKGAGERA
jgi:hypothetical protein